MHHTIVNAALSFAGELHSPPASPKQLSDHHVASFSTTYPCARASIQITQHILHVSQGNSQTLKRLTTPPSPHINCSRPAVPSTPARTCPPNWSAYYCSSSLIPQNSSRGATTIKRRATLSYNSPTFHHRTGRRVPTHSRMYSQYDIVQDLFAHH